MSNDSNNNSNSSINDNNNDDQSPQSEQQQHTNTQLEFDTIYAYSFLYPLTISTYMLSIIFASYFIYKLYKWSNITYGNKWYKLHISPIIAIFGLIISIISSLLSILLSTNIFIPYISSNSNTNNINNNNNNCTTNYCIRCILYSKIKNITFEVSLLVNYFIIFHMLYDTMKKSSTLSIQNNKLINCMKGFLLLLFIWQLITNIFRSTGNVYQITPYESNSFINNNNNLHICIIKYATGNVTKLKLHLVTNTIFIFVADFLILYLFLSKLNKLYNLVLNNNTTQRQNKLPNNNNKLQLSNQKNKIKKSPNNSKHKQNINETPNFSRMLSISVSKSKSKSKSIEINAITAAAAGNIINDTGSFVKFGNIKIYTKNKDLINRSTLRNILTVMSRHSLVVLTHFIATIGCYVIPTAILEPGNATLAPAISTLLQSLVIFLMFPCGEKIYYKLYKHPNLFCLKCLIFAKTTNNKENNNNKLDIAAASPAQLIHVIQKQAQATNAEKNLDEELEINNEDYDDENYDPVGINDDRDVDNDNGSDEVSGPATSPQAPSSSSTRSKSKSHASTSASYVHGKADHNTSLF